VHSAIFQHMKLETEMSNRGEKIGTHWQIDIHPVWENESG
jgi:hypothetical protein